MNPSQISRHPRVVAALAFLLTAAAASAQTTFYKANNTTSLTSTTQQSWWFDELGTVPVPPAQNPVNTTSPTARCIFNNLITGPLSPTMADVGIKYLEIRDVGGAITLDGGATLRTITTAGNAGDQGGIDMTLATADLNIGNINFRPNASGAVIAINVATGRNLNFATNSTVIPRSNASNVTININTLPGNAGTVNIGGHFQASHVVIGAGRVAFTRASGNSRLSTNTTILNGGTLFVSNSSNSATGSGAVTLNAGTLTSPDATVGSATLSGTVTANAGSSIAPGENATGTLNLGGLVLNADSTIIWEGITPADSDRINVTGANLLTINGGTLKLYQPGTTNPFNGVGAYTIFGVNGAISGAGVSALTIDESTKIPGRNYLIAEGAGVVTLTIIDGSLSERDWAVDASGDWNTASNWTGNDVPNSATEIASISGLAGAALTAPRTITLDAPVTVNGLVLDAVQPVTLAGTSTLSMDANGGASAIDASGADHLIEVPISLSTGGALSEVADARVLTISGGISGLGAGLAKVGGGELRLTGTNTYTGITSVSAGTLRIGAGGTTGSVDGTIAVGGTLIFDRSDSIVLSQPISGTGSLQFVGSGDRTLSVANTFSGTTSIAGGTVVLANSQALQSARLNLSSTGGSVQVDGAVSAVTLGGLAGDGSFPAANTTATALALTINNSTTNAFSGSLVGTAASLVKNGSGAQTLSGTHAYSTSALVSNGTLEISGGAFSAPEIDLGTGTASRLLVSGGTLTASSTTATTALPNAAIGIEVTGGTANFDGGIESDANNSAGDNFVLVTGGTLNTKSISLSRGSLNIGSEPTSGQVSQGFYLNGDTAVVNVAEGLDLGAVSGANSSVTGRMDRGSLNIGGTLTVGINNTGRWSAFDVNGGTLTASGSPGISLGSPFAGKVILFIRNSAAVVHTTGIRFGQGALAGESVLSLSAGSLYVGADGMQIGSSDLTFLPVARLNGGVLGASANWSGNVPLAINGSAVVTGADAGDTAYTVTLSGPTSGNGDLTKNGSGTVLLTSPANNFLGPVVVNQGTLGLGGKIVETLTVAEGAAFAPQSVFTADFGANINGTLKIVWNASDLVPVPMIQSGFGINLGANSVLNLSGTGQLTAPAYILVKAGAGIGGAFSSITGVPPGYSINLAFDDDNDANTPASIALVGGPVASPFQVWAEAAGLVGPDALPTADVDGDGLDNATEYGLGTSPTASDADGAIAIALNSGRVTVTFTQPGDPALAFTVEATSNLMGTWTPVHTFLPFEAAGVAEYTDTVDVVAGTPRFLRVRVVLNE